MPQRIRDDGIGIDWATAARFPPPDGVCNPVRNIHWITRNTDERVDRVANPVQPFRGSLRKIPDQRSAIVMPQHIRDDG
jgi:hypothetical protein